MKRSKDTAKQPPAVTKKPLAGAELDKVSSGDQMGDLDQQALKEIKDATDEPIRTPALCSRSHGQRRSVAEVRKAGPLREVAALADRRGYGFTADELAATAQERAAAVGRKLSAADLDAVISAGCRNAGDILHDIFGRR